MSTQLRLLILEDDSHDAELEIATIEECGYACRWERVETRAEFAACLDKRDYDLILADFNLPTFDGLSALRMFLEHDVDVPFILVSGTLGEETAIESLKAGATEYVLKDRISRLGPVVQRALLEKEEQRQRRRAEAALRESEAALRRNEELLRNLFDNVSDFIYTHDFDGRFVTVNRAAAQIGGYTPDELIGRKINDFMLTQYGDAFFEKYLTQITAQGHFNGISKYLDKEAKVHYVEYRNVLVTGEGTEPYVSGVGRDVTDRIEAEKKIKELERQFRQAQKMEAIGTLAGGIAHDFNNILSAVIGYTELAINDTEKDSSVYSVLQQVLHAGERAKSLVRQILAFSRQTEQEHKPVQIGYIAKEALKFLRASLPTSIEIRQQIRSESLVMADPTQIHQILMNLCTNAEHAMREKGGYLTVTLEDVEIDADFIGDHPEMKPGSYNKLTVNDTGQGIPAHLIDQIFDPFFTTKEQGDGTGMGLAVVHGIVASYGGMVSAFSTPGQGTTFEVYLAVAEKRIEIPAKIETELPTGTERILFVDDEPILADLGKQILESLGYDVTTRTSSIEALELFKARPDRFDLVITDMTMPRLTGDNLAGELVRIRSDLPVILCTGFSAKIDEQKATAMGIRAFVSKPVLIRDMAETIRKVLDPI